MEHNDLENQNKSEKENIEIDGFETVRGVDRKKTGDAFPNSKFPLAVLAIAAILISSTFGAVFGFMASGVGRSVYADLTEKYPSLGKLAPSGTDVTKQRIVEDDSAVIDVVEKAQPAVVSIVVTKDVPIVRNYRPDPGDPFGFWEFFGGGGQGNGTGQTEKQKVSGGSGFFISGDGMIVTNKHVVSDTGADYTVITNDNKEHQAQVLARDPVNDIAVIKIEGSGYPTLEFGDSDSLKAGQTVIAIGNSLGEFSNTVSKGIVSGLRRNVTAGGDDGESETLNNIIQTDAAINPGNSGGPLLNMDGQVIGVNVAVAEGAENIGFAIPSDQVQRVVKQVKETGKITAPYLGVRYVMVDDRIQQENNLPYNYGALVIRGQNSSELAVVPGSPADKAGITENDIILEIDETKIKDGTTLSQIVAKKNAGDEVSLKIWSKGQVRDMKVKLGERS